MGLFLLCVISDMLVYSEVWMHWYDRYIFVGISDALGFVFGIFPFSVGDVIYTLIFIGLLFILVKCTKNIFAKKWQEVFRWSYRLFCTLSLLYAGLNLLWNHNYYRPSLVDKMNLKLNKYSVKELVLLGEYLVEHTNLYRSKVNENYRGIAYSGLDFDNLADMIYRQMQQDIESFGVSQLRRDANVKAMFYPTLFNYLKVSGYYVPFTSESNVNSQMPQVSIPFTISHELAHWYGIASEGEANFIAFLCGRMHTHYFVKYSAYFGAMRYVLSELRKMAFDRYEQLYASLTGGVKRDLDNLVEYYQKYINPLDNIFDMVYDTYLKSQNQVEGIKGYNAMVELMIAAKVYM